MGRRVKIYIRSFTVSIHPTTANNEPPTMPRTVRMKTPNLTGRQQQKVREGTVADMINVQVTSEGLLVKKKACKKDERTIIDVDA